MSGIVQLNKNVKTKLLVGQKSLLALLENILVLCYTTALLLEKLAFTVILHVLYGTIG